MQSSDFGPLVGPDMARGGLAKVRKFAAGGAVSEVGPTPRSGGLGALADMSKRIQEALNIKSPSYRPGDFQIPIGDMLLGQAPKLLDRLSYGDKLTTAGPGNGRPYIPELQPDAKSQVGDTLMAAQPFMGTAGKVASRTSKVLSPQAQKIADGVREFVGGMADSGTIPQRALAQQGAVRPKGGNWGGVNLDKDLAGLGTTARPEVKAWRDNQLARYVKTYLGTAEDPLLQVEKEGKLHMTPEQMETAQRTNGFIGAREKPAPEDGPAGVDHVYGLGEAHNGFPAGGNEFHQQATGRNYRTPWENVSDNSPYQTNPQDQLDVARRMNGYNPAPAKYDWMTKQDPGTQLLDATQVRSLGFDHVLDFLHQSDLTEAQLKHVSVPDAVRMTSDWNTQLAKRMADENNAKLTSGTITHKEYDDGMKWVQIGGHTEEHGLPPGHSMEQHPSGSVTMTDPAGNQTLDLSKQDAINRAWAPHVDAGLNAEGECMGHCVGGYGEEVRNNGTKIFSLRDKNNQPHVTIEARPPEKSNFSGADRVNDLVEGASTLADDHQGAGYMDNFVKEVHGDDYDNMYRHYAGQYGKYVDMGDDAHHLGMNILKDMSPEAAAAHQDFLNTMSQEGTSIEQIKGKQNAAPVAKYLPYVQDFVKSGKWSEVNDLENTGLLKGSPGSTRIEGQKMTMPEDPYYTTKDLADHFINQGAHPAAAYQHSGYIEPLLDSAHPDSLANRFPDLADPQGQAPQE